MSELLLDRPGRRRSPATVPGFHAARPPGNKGVRYPADPRRYVGVPPRPPGRSAVLRHQRRRFAPHQLRHAHAVEMAREGVPLTVIQRQLGQSNLGITSIYLQGIDSGEIIETLHARRAPTIAVSASLRM
jgi:integrase